ncbi:MAG: hypothetical protein U0R78_10180 [Nocardioidaceae bacterium]
MAGRPSLHRPWAILLSLALLGVIATTVLAGRPVDDPGAPAEPAASASSDGPSRGPSGSPGAGSGLGGFDLLPATPPLHLKPRLPGGRTAVFGQGRFLVAYYGTAGTGALGVLGETNPDTATQRLRRAARPFARPGRPVQPVYELIVTIADASPGRSGDYSHAIARTAVQRYIDAAHRHGALLLLDIQPGRSHFLPAAQHWAWALRDPWVGLALDPEWRMGPRQVPAHVVGSVSTAEVNRTAAWLASFTRAHHLPQKLFVVHQFKTSMIRDIGTIRRHPELALVQHVDGFGTPSQKLATYHTVARPRLFTMGFKLFYDEDVHRMSARAVQAIRPPVRFVSFQ